MIQFGQGSRQKRIRASITGQTSQIAIDIAGDKSLTKQLLAEAGLPVAARQRSADRGRCGV